MCNSFPDYRIRRYSHARDFPPVLILFASGMDSELAKYAEYVKEQDETLRVHDE